MKRRKFVKNLGKGISSSIFIPSYLKRQREDRIGAYQYPVPGTLDNAKNMDGHVAVRIELKGKSSAINDRIAGRFAIKNGRIDRIRNYFSLGNNSLDISKGRFDLSVYQNDMHSIALWIDKVSEKTSFEFRNQIEDVSFDLNILVSGEEFLWENDKFILKANLLLYHEIGYIDIGKTLNIDARNETFRFVIMADPQGGDPDDKTNDSSTRMKIHNAFIEESIDVANELVPESLFTIILGDFTDSKGQKSNFNKMIGFYEKLQNPILLEIGNHETRYGAVFTPGYNMNEFENYFSAQKHINGLEKLLYSFDVGQWHFIIWPDPLRKNFWNTHPHYFDWLERDLEANRNKPVFFLQHVPIHPIGINPLVSYVNDSHVNRLLFDILSKYGNVKYVFSGHVHIPIKSSKKTAVNYKGIKMINLPPTGYRPRAFGEPDLFGGPSQGITIIDVNPDRVDIGFRTVTRELYKYPDKLIEYKKEDDPLWFNYKWELKANDQLMNGDFNDDLNFWLKQYVYTEDQSPSNICEIRHLSDLNVNSLYLYSSKREYDKPGQDRLPQTNNQVSQVISGKPDKVPLIKFNFYIDEKHFHPESWNGAFFWIEGYVGMHQKLSLLYSAGRAHRSVGGSYGSAVRTSFFNITDTPGKWHKVILNIYQDFKLTNENASFPESGIDKYVLNFGTWTINDGFQQEIGIYIADVQVEFIFADHTGVSRLNDKPADKLKEEYVWRHRMQHIAGEHKYATQEELYPY